VQTKEKSEQLSNLDLPTTMKLNGVFINYCIY